MSRNRILVVEDDRETADYLRTYFDWQGYEVLTTERGGEALDTCRVKLPSAVILDIVLPDISGFEVCRALRDNNRTSYVPIIFLSYRNKRNDIIGAFEAGADDFVIKPFDIEELKLRVEGAIRYSRRGAFMHPVTNLPAGELITDQLKFVKESPEPWTVLYFTLNNLGVFRAVSTFGAVEEVLTLLADILRESVDQYGSPHDFVGQVSDDGFIVVTIPENAGPICTTVIDRFKAEEVTVAQTTGLLKLGGNVVSSYDGPFTDIRQIAKRLAEHRLSQSELAEHPGQLYGPPTQASDLDYYNQLAEQVTLWQTAPELAQALSEAERLLMAKIPDLHRIKLLLDLVEPGRLPTETLGNLRAHQQLGFLASENLNELLRQIQRYQEFEPASLLNALEYIASLWPDAPATVSFLDDKASELKVAWPELRLQQVIYNICQWLRSQAESARLMVSVAVTVEGVSLLFELPDSLKGSLQPSTLLRELNRNKTGAVYGYLAHKLLTRYGGQMKSDGGQLLVSLPLAAAEATAGQPQVEVKELRAKIREHRAFLDRHKRLGRTADIFDKAANLIDPLAEDLLAEIETMLAVVNTNPSIDHRVYPWLSLFHNLRFCRMLALELRRNRPLIPAPVNLKSLVESVRPLVAHRVIDHELVIESDTERPVINTDQTRLLQVLVNLALNALEAAEALARSAGRITLSSSCT